MIMKKIIVVMSLFVVLAAPVQAERFPPIKNAEVKSECGECHMAYFPQMLPRKSWQRIFGELGDHFGEDASLDDKTLSSLRIYYLNNASDVSDLRAARKWQEDLSVGEAPERITTAPRFVRKHDELSPRVWSDPEVNSKANCGACHTNVAKTGDFDEDRMEKNWEGGFVDKVKSLFGGREHDKKHRGQ